MWVVKLGGSLLGTEELREWLALLAKESDGRIVIVPGGGVFADTVREHQAFGRYDDGTAHHMALLAMEQYGHVLQSLQPDLVTAATELEIAERSWQHRAIIWMPSHMVLADGDIPQSWDVTSDSLAAWLAAKIGADRLVLVKHRAVSAHPLSFSHLIEEGLLDRAFDTFAQNLPCPISILGKADHRAFAEAWNGGPAPALAF